MISFLTWNLYTGADFAPIFFAAPEMIPQRVTEVFRQFQATSFPDRAKGLAAAIGEKKPDIIGLQEANLVQLMSSQKEIVTYDFLRMILGHLKKRGLDYETAVIHHHSLFQFPASDGNVVSLLDRDAILLRKKSKLKIVRRQKGNYAAHFTVNIGNASYPILRGWSAVDLEGRKGIFRVINTHLESFTDNVRLAQGMELLSGPANTSLPLVVMGDLNCDGMKSQSSIYRHFIARGFHDLWHEAGKGPGFTCCQDSDLLNEVSQLNKRIDYILFKNGWKAVAARLTGEKNREKGLWLSDHAGVYGRLYLKDWSQ